MRRAPPTPHDVSQLGIRELCHDLSRELLVAHHLLRTALRESASLRLRETAAVREPLSALEVLLAELTATVAQAARPPAPRRIDLRTAARACCARAGLTFQGTLELEVRSAVMVCGDGVQLKRALSNLLSAACQAAPSGRVRVRVTASTSHAHVDVHDDATPVLGNAGPELWIAKTVAEAWGGCLTLGHSELGGTRVGLELPLAVAL